LGKLALQLVLLTAAACGEDQPPPDRGVPAADVDLVLPDLGVQFGSDAEAASTDAALASDAAVGLDAPPPVTDCAGSCGVYLEGNPCHCHAGCAAEGNCCGGSSAFAATCSCTKPTDCDDNSPCTSDSCLDGICRQIPVGTGCCEADSDCSGGNACTLARCLDNACALVPKDCSDGLSCTLDSCQDGVCNHALLATTCYVEGQCYAAGESAKQGCGVCDPAKSTTSLATPPGQCQIDGKCYAAGQAPDLACAYCDPVALPDAFTVKQGWCVIEGQCIAAGSSHPTSTCLQCKPESSKYNWTIQEGFCHIGGKCITAKTGVEGGCSVCNPQVNAVDWTPSASGSCSLPCLSGGACQAGKCVGTPLPASQCCTSNSDCAGQIPNLSACQEAVCNPSTNKCLAQTKQDCCVSGVCCDVATNSYKPAGSDCNGPVSDK